MGDNTPVGRAGESKEGGLADSTENGPFKRFLHCLAGLLPAGLAVCMLLVTCCGAGGREGERGITVYVAASMSDVLTEAAPAFTRQSGINVGLEFASSGSLARKIEAGAPTDLFISANKKWIDYLEEKRIISSVDRKIIARNQLVCVEPVIEPTGITSAQQLLRAQRISIGDPEHVPAGAYAREALVHHGLWDALNRQGKLVFAMTVRVALAFVEQGEVSGGIVYKTDALLTDKVKVAFNFSQETHTPITYHASVVSGTKKVENARRFLGFISSEAFHSILLKRGFLLP